MGLMRRAGRKGPEMGFLDFDALSAAPLNHDPFDYLVLERFVRPEARPEIAEAYPAIAKPGSFALEDVEVKGALAGLIEELKGDAFRRAIEARSEEHTSELQSLTNLVCRLLLEN